MVGLDGLKQSDTALRVACDIARKYGSEIHLVHAPQPATVAFALGAVAGYHAATTMPDGDKVREFGEKLSMPAKQSREKMVLLSRIRTWGTAIRQTNSLPVPKIAVQI